MTKCQTPNAIPPTTKTDPSTRRYATYAELGSAVDPLRSIHRDPDSIMDEAIEAGAEEIETDGEGNIVVATPPTGTAQVSQAISEKYGLKVLSSKIVWAANKDTEVKLDSSPQLIDFTQLLETLNDMGDVHAVYANITQGNISDEEWARIAENIEF